MTPFVASLINAAVTRIDHYQRLLQLAKTARRVHTVTLFFFQRS